MMSDDDLPPDGELIMQAYDLAIALSHRRERLIREIERLSRMEQRAFDRLFRRMRRFAEEHK